MVHLEDLVCRRPCTGVRVETVEREEGGVEDALTDRTLSVQHDGAEHLYSIAAGIGTTSPPWLCLDGTMLDSTV